MPLLVGLVCSVQEIKANKVESYLQLLPIEVDSNHVVPQKVAFSNDIIHFCYGIMLWYNVPFDIAILPAKLSSKSKVDTSNMIYIYVVGSSK